MRIKTWRGKGKENVEEEGAGRQKEKWEKEG